MKSDDEVAAGAAEDYVCDPVNPQRQGKERTMKIRSIEIDTDLGRRVVQVSPPIDVDPTTDMPPHFRSLTELLWNILRQVATSAPSFDMPKAEA